MNFVYKNYLTPELEKTIVDSPNLHKFARELNHVFNLYAYAFTEYDNGNHHLYMCSGNGVHVCTIYMSNEYQDGKQIPQFNYYSNWYSKARGSSDQDRKTLSSIKLSSLISTLKRHKVVPSTSDTHKTIKSIIGGLHTNMVNSIKSVGYKSSHDIDADIYHTMLKILLKCGDPSLLMRYDRSKLEAVLQKFDAVDKVAAEREVFIKERLHGGSLYGVCVGDHGDYLVAKFNVDEKLEAEVLEINRVKSVKESYEQFIPILTMFKVAKETSVERQINVSNNDGWHIPRTDSYDANLDVSSYYTRSGFDGNSTWVVFPCSAT
jgi:hypothetical protein